MSTKEIIALRHPIENATTGAVSDYHVLASYHVVKSPSFVQMTFETYVSEQTFEAGRHPIPDVLTLMVHELPSKGVDVEQWLMGVAPSATDSSTGGEETPLQGATPVYATEEV